MIRFFSSFFWWFYEFKMGIPKGNPALTKRSKVGQGVLTPGQTRSDPVKDNAEGHNFQMWKYHLSITDSDPAELLTTKKFNL
jgi:hypothetical protein